MTNSEKGLREGHGPGRNTAFSLVSQLSGAAFSVALTLFLVRKLGPTDYGVLALAVSIGTVVLLFSDLGIAISASRFVAEQPHDRLRSAAILRTGFLLKSAASGFATVLVVLLASPLADVFGAPGLVWPIRIVAIAVAAQNMGALFLEWFIGLGRISFNVGYGLTESAVETTTAICLVLLGAGAAGAAAGRAAGFTVAGVLAAILAVRLVDWPAIRAARKKPFPARRILRYGSALLLIDGAFVLFDRTDVIIIGAILNATSAGIFEAGARVLTMLQYPGIAVGAGYGPRLAAGRQTREDVARFMAALRYSVLLYVLLAVPTLVWAGPIASLLLGGGYSESADVLRALAPSVVLSGIGPVLAGAANFLGAARKRVPLAVGALLINVVIDLALVSEIGVVAGAIGTGVAFLFYTGGHLWICSRALGVSLAPVGLTLLRALLAGVVAGLALLLFGTADLSPVAWGTGSVLATAGYVGTLLLLRELSVAEMRQLIRRLKPGQRDSRGVLE